MDVWVDRWLPDGCVDIWTDGRMDEWMFGYGRMDGLARWTDGSLVMDGLNKQRNFFSLNDGSVIFKVLTDNELKAYLCIIVAHFIVSTPHPPPSPPPKM